MIVKSLLRVRPLSWQRILEDSQLLKGFLNKIPLVVSDGLTKDVCLGLHYLAKQVIRMGRKSGWLFVALYLKQASTCLMQYYAVDSPSSPSELSVPISLTRSGLPRIIPPYHRKMIRLRNERSDMLVRCSLSALSLAKVIRLAKKVSKTTFSSITDRPQVPIRDLVNKSLDMFSQTREYLERYIPKISTIPFTFTSRHGMESYLEGHCIEMQASQMGS